MLERLHLKNVGPTPELTMELAPRLNLITGDNGYGEAHRGVDGYAPVVIVSLPQSGTKKRSPRMPSPRATGKASQHS